MICKEGCKPLDGTPSGRNPLGCFNIRDMLQDGSASNGNTEYNPKKQDGIEKNGSFNSKDSKSPNSHLENLKSSPIPTSILHVSKKPKNQRMCTVPSLAVPTI